MIRHYLHFDTFMGSMTSTAGERLTEEQIESRPNPTWTGKAGWYDYRLNTELHEWLAELGHTNYSFGCDPDAIQEKGLSWWLDLPEDLTILFKLRWGGEPWTRQ